MSYFAVFDQPWKSYRQVQFSSVMKAKSCKRLRRILRYDSHQNGFLFHEIRPNTDFLLTVLHFFHWSSLYYRLLLTSGLFPGNLSRECTEVPNSSLSFIFGKITISRLWNGATFEPAALSRWQMTEWWSMDPSRPNLCVILHVPWLENFGKNLSPLYHLMRNDKKYFLIILNIRLKGTCLPIYASLEPTQCLMWVDGLIEERLNFLQE